jgi:glycosyltransferase involved in cell wall biosynthesis/GR25 family glycosyltransferase involved in LPS biosynthesis
MKFLEKYYKPWSLTWIVQRTLLLFKERRRPQLSARTLIVDYRLTRKVRKNLRQAGVEGNAAFPGAGETFLTGLVYDSDLSGMITCENIPANELSYLNTFFDHIYILNLARRPDRCSEMIRKLNQLKIRAEFFTAVDGYTPANLSGFSAYLSSPIDLDNAHEMEIRLKRKVIYSPGGWGILKTYLNLFKDAGKRGFERILCLEDDVIFSKSFEKRFRDSASKLPADWKLLYLGASQHTWESGVDLIFPKTSNAYYLPLNTDSSFAFGVHKTLFGELIAEISRMNCPFDSGPLRTVSKQHQGDCFVLYPNLVIADVEESDITLSRKMADFAALTRWDLADFDLSDQGGLVSIIMPAYNAERTIELSLRSLLLQTYKNLEIIVVNDDSTDKTGQIAEKMAAEDRRIKVIHAPENRGCYAARNLGLQQSSGQYIAIQDADDISVKTRIHRQLIPILLGRAEFSITRALRSRLKPGEISLDNQAAFLRNVLENRSGKDAVVREYRDQPVIGLATTLFSGKLVDEAGPFREARFGADAEYIERILYLKAGKKFEADDPPVNTFLDKQKNFKGIYERIDLVQLVSVEFEQANLTKTYDDGARKAYQAEWRKNMGQYGKK